MWSKVLSELENLKLIKNEIDSLSKFDSDKVIYYKAFNIYIINNPLLNEAEQEIKKYFLFGSNLNIIGKEDFEK